MLWSMKRSLRVGVALLGCAAALLAHHGYVLFYHIDQHLTLKGQVTKVIFEEPHVRLTLATKGSGTWDAEWTKPTTLAVDGVKPDTVKVGDVLEIEASPAINPAWRIVSAVMEIRRPADGWHWGRSSTQVRGTRTIE